MNYYYYNFSYYNELEGGQVRPDSHLKEMCFGDYWVCPGAEEPRTGLVYL